MSKHKHKHKEPKMSTLEELEALYVSQDSPINPCNVYKKKGTGYNFYLTIRDRIPGWWEEFNSELDSHNRLKYTTIGDFIKKKTDKSIERKYLHQMFGPASNRNEDVPWLGNWEKRRSAGFGVLDDSNKIKPLIKVIQNNMAAVESIKSLTPVLVEELVQYTALQKQVHEAFAGKAFIRDKSADDKKNASRFEAYKLMLWSLSELKIKIVNQIMRVHGVNPSKPEMMREIAQIAGGVGAAAAITGIAAGQRIPGLGQAMQLPDGSAAITPYTYDAIKLAEHLTRHAHTFKKPLPPDIEGEVVTTKEEKRSHKGNGKVV